MEDKQAVEIPLHIIAPDGDLVLELMKSELIHPTPQTGQKTKLVPVARFRVKRATMTGLTHWNKNRDSVFKVMLTGSFKEAKQTTVEIEEDDHDALKIFLSICHFRFFKSLFDCGHEIMWPLVKIFDKYNVSLKPLAEKWFGKWYENKGDKIDEIPAQEMLFPCWKFNYAPGFLQASNSCIYGVPRHINDKNPDSQHMEFRLPSRILQQLNSARGRLRSLIHNEIWSPARNLLDFSCPCDGGSVNGGDENKLLPSGARPPHTCDPASTAPCRCRCATVCGYIRALERTGAWPLDDTWTKESANAILAKLDDFSYSHKVPDCIYCKNDFNSGVAIAVDKVRRYLDGICLDCIKDSETSERMKNNPWDYMDHTGSREDPYYRRKHVGNWSYGCRVKHGEPTWYFSSLARKHKD